MTVAVIDPTVTQQTIYDRRSENDFQVTWYSGSGAGGQHRNRHMNSARIKHIPSGIEKSSQTRDRKSSYKNAMDALIIELDRLKHNHSQSVLNDTRASQVGSGMRGDKSVTIRFQDDHVKLHANGKETTATRYMKGFMDDLWT